MILVYLPFFDLPGGLITFGLDSDYAEKPVSICIRQKKETSWKLVHSHIQTRLQPRQRHEVPSPGAFALCGSHKLRPTQTQTPSEVPIFGTSSISHCREVFVCVKEKYQAALWQSQHFQITFHNHIMTKDDSFQLYDLRVEVVCPPGERIMCGAKEGDYFTLQGEMMYLPPGQGISIYSLGSSQPPPKQGLCAH